jgi:5-methylcytosine-specific restriction endonuclease McrA
MQPKNPPDRSKGANYDATYYLKNLDKRRKQNREISSTEEQKLYRKLYTRWRMAASGKKIPAGEPFDKPSKDVRLKLIARRNEGCIACQSKEQLVLDHTNEDPNDNSLQNLQWLCTHCHKQKTAKERAKALYRKSA